MAKIKKCCAGKDPARLNKVGGQAVLEGVMMKAGARTVTSCRKEDGTIVVNDDSFVSVRKKHKFLNIPILRGVVNFVEMMALSFKTLNASAEAMGIEEEDGKIENWCKKHLGVKLTDLIMGIALVLGLMLSLFLFKFLPVLVTEGIDWLYSYFSGGGTVHPVAESAIEGGVKIAIFILYLALVSLMPDIKRTFMYHGAEHKSIACFESGDELTPENAKKHKRFHPRCGTSFMFLMILIGIAVSICIKLIFPHLHWAAYFGISLLTLPLTMGIGYEVLMLAGKHDNFLTRMISAPGLWVQRITTKEPTLDMLEIAITSIKCALRDDFPEFREFFDARGWEKKPEDEEKKPENTEDDPITEENGDQPEAEEPNENQITIAELEGGDTDGGTEGAENEAE